MRQRFHRSSQKVNNSGSALVTVIVVITFISILATTILYVASMNYQMKLTDYNTKKTFYVAEIPMEEIRQQLVEDAASAYATAYQQTVAEYITLGSAGRASRFETIFSEEMRKIWEGRAKVLDESGTFHYDWDKAIKDVVSVPYKVLKFIPDGVTNAGITSDLSEGYVYLKGINVTYTDEYGYTSVIKTDFCVVIPQLDWSIERYSDAYDSDYGNSRKVWDFDKNVTYWNWTKQ